MRLTLQPCSTRVCLPSPAAARPMQPSRTCAPPSRTLMRATPSDKASTLPELNVNSISSSQSGLLASSSFSPGASDDLIFPSGARGAPASASARSQGVVVTVRNMTKRYDTQKGPFFAVKDVSLDIHPGTITALLGPSGSGKTTLMRLVAGLEEATSGQVYFGDEDMTARSVQDRELGFLFQGYALFRHMTVAENIAFGPRVRKMDIDIDARVEELLALVGLTGYGKRYPPQLSGGQRQRVALARALGCNPQLLLLDEPFGALDPLVRKALRGSLKEIVSSIGVTTIIVTHDQEEAWDLADEVIIFNRGRIEQRGMPEQITRHPKSPFVMNFVGGVLHLPSNCQFLRRMGLAVPQPYVMIRPAHIDVHKTFEGKKNICAATVKDKSRVGWLVNYTIVFDDGVDIELTVGRKEDELFYDFAAGDRVYLTADINNVVPFSPSEIDDPMFEEVVMLGARAA